MPPPRLPQRPEHGWYALPIGGPDACLVPIPLLVILQEISRNTFVLDALRYNDTAHFPQPPRSKFLQDLFFLLF